VGVRISTRSKLPIVPRRRPPCRPCSGGGGLHLPHAGAVGGTLDRSLVRAPLRHREYSRSSSITSRGARTARTPYFSIPGAPGDDPRARSRGIRPERPARRGPGVDLVLPSVGPFPPGPPSGPPPDSTPRRGALLDSGGWTSIHERASGPAAASVPLHAADFQRRQDHVQFSQVAQESLSASASRCRSEARLASSGPGCRRGFQARSRDRLERRSGRDRLRMLHSSQSRGQN